MRDDHAELLSRVTLFVEGECGLPGPWSITETLGETPARQVYRLNGPSGTLIGKSCSNEAGKRAHDLLQALGRRHFETLRLPRSLGFDSASGVLIMTEAAGAACSRGPLPDLHCFRRIGRALRELHETSLASELRPKLLCEHVAELIRPDPVELARRFPQYAPLIREALERLVATSSRQEKSVVLLHRDYHLRQLFDDGKHITVVDWDLVGHGEAAFDVGYFTAYMRSHFEESESVPRVDEFLKGYAPNSTTLARVPVHESFNYLRRACRRYRLQDANWEFELERMMRRLERSLQVSRRSLF